MIMPSFFFVFGVVLFWIANAYEPCYTPNNELAECISLYDCGLIMQAIRTINPKTERFLRESQCGYEEDDGPWVCCGSVVGFQDSSNPKNEVTRQSREDLLPNRTSCGLWDIADRLLGGKITELIEYPWLALLIYKKSGDDNFSFSCGGSLINNRYVLTAAHCVTGGIEQQVGDLSYVRLGEWDISTAVDCSPLGSQNCSGTPVDVLIEKTVIHDGYRSNSRHRQNDIALLRLSNEVTYTKYIRPICLPQVDEQSAVGSEVTISGWGRTENSSYSSVKLKLKVPIVSQSRCKRLYNSTGVIITDMQLCAGGIENQDSCNGDSGGPLMQDVQNSDPSQIYIEGIVSFGVNCGTQNFPAVYTRVSNYLTWIYNNLEP